MIVPDTSAWVDYLRDAGTPVHRVLARLIDSEADLFITECVAMEVLAGASSPSHLRQLESMLLTLPILPLEGLADYEEAAELYRTCRRAGSTIWKMTDCLIAVPVMRAGAELLHSDRDFDVIAQHSSLRIYSVS